MNVHDDVETDSLYIALSDKVGAESREVVPGVVLDFDADGHVVGIDIDRASQSLTSRGSKPTRFLSSSVLGTRP